MLIGLLGLAFGGASGWFLTKRASTTRWAPWALPVHLSRQSVSSSSLRASSHGLLPVWVLASPQRSWC